MFKYVKIVRKEKFAYIKRDYISINVFIIVEVACKQLLDLQE